MSTTRYSQSDDTYGAQEDTAVKSAGPAPQKAAGAFKTISEVANDLDVQQHVLRFWETKFSQVKPLKRGGGRRYYRPEDVELLKAIHYLLYTDGYTIKGVQKMLREKGKGSVLEAGANPENISEAPQNSVAAAAEPPKPSSSGVRQGLTETQRRVLRDMLTELKEIRGMLD